MFVELVDALRCPRPHAETWLVLASRRADGRHVVEGVLGCPACGAEYAIEGGVPRFAVAPDAARPQPAPLRAPIDEDETTRAAALLNLVGSGGIVLLTGAWRALAAPLFDLVPAQYVLIDPAPAALDPRDEREGISVVAAHACVPLGAGSLRAAALEGSYLESSLLAAVTRELRAHGRLVLPAAAPLPPDVRELAADDRHRVGELTVTASAPVGLGRRR